MRYIYVSVEPYYFPILDVVRLQDYAAFDLQFVQTASGIYEVNDATRKCVAFRVSADSPLDQLQDGSSLFVELNPKFTWELPTWKLIYPDIDGLYFYLATPKSCTLLPRRDLLPTLQMHHEWKLV